MDTISLHGKWRYETDESDSGELAKIYKRSLIHDGFEIPGTSCSNGIGTKTEYFEELTKEAVRAPREKYEYIGALWLQREFEIPPEWENGDITLFFERVNVASEIWIDGEKCSRRITELSVPHIYRIKPAVGKHTLTVRLDNRNLLNLDTMASGYSIDTQGYWNGIIGKAELRCENAYHTENIQVYPDKSGIDVSLTAVSRVSSPGKTENAQIELTVYAPNGDIAANTVIDTQLYNSRQPERCRIDIEKPQYWSEFEQPMYTLCAVMKHGGEVCDEKSVRFGMRTVCVEDKRIKINGEPVFLRGTTDCAQFPLTGCPDMRYEEWERRFKIIKSYGFNHVRFHAWCPPECAFQAADDIGLYVLAEMPLWLNYDVCALEAGDDSVHRQYFDEEAVAISKTYGNHPSFIMFSNGNEIMGDFEMLEDITRRIKTFDNRRIYTLTSNFDHKISPFEDYMSAFEAGGHRIRLQTFGNEIAESSYIDYDDAVSDMNVPIVSFEVGQYCVYPDVDCTEKYTGNILPVNFDAIKKHMKSKGVYQNLKKYIKASGDFALKFYKEDIEAAMRTEGFGGFELLAICDYTGQSTATVGMLDVFYDSKGITNEAEFSSFNSDLVPLISSKRVFAAGEDFEGELKLFDFSKNKGENRDINITISNGANIIYSSTHTVGHIRIPLGDVQTSSVLEVTAECAGHKNSWRIFVMKPCEAKTVKVISCAEDIANAVREGGSYIVTGENIKEPINGSFLPVFWSPVHFPSHKTCGMIVKKNHPALAHFPTDEFSDFQWKKPIEHSVGVCTSDFGADFEAILEPVPNFVDNTPRSPLFEAHIGNADILFCGFCGDECIETKTLLASIKKYAASEEFSPKQSIDENVFLKLFK